MVDVFFRTRGYQLSRKFERTQSADRFDYNTSLAYAREVEIKVACLEILPITSIDELTITLEDRPYNTKKSGMDYKYKNYQICLE